jgi:hypothetical protein
MIDFRPNQVDEVLLSFKYPSKRLASECNQKFEDLVHSTIIPSLEHSFNSVSSQGINLEIESLEVDLGKISKDDIDEGLGQQLYKLIKEALEREIEQKMGISFSTSSRKGVSKTNLLLLALESFLIKGYFPYWMDSSWNLDKILNELLTNSSQGLSRLIGDSIKKNESVRFRVASLEDQQFDAIIGLLIPEDAEWIIAYRETYLRIQKEHAELNSPEKQLKQALNLFIINYIALESGPRFNRMSFSNNFLKSIAAHHNLEFEFFLKEVIQIVNQIPISTSWHRGFKETIEWVAVQNSEPEDQSGYPGFQELIHWFNFSPPSSNLPSWLAQWVESGRVLKIILERYAGFWNQLSPRGNKKLFETIAGKEGENWEKIANQSFAFIQNESELLKKPSAEIGIKDLLSFISRQSEREILNLTTREDWYKMVLTFAFSFFNSKTIAQVSKFKFLVKLGMDHGVSEAPLIVGALLYKQTVSAQNLQESRSADQKVIKEFPEEMMAQEYSENDGKEEDDSSFETVQIGAESSFSNGIKNAEIIAEEILWRYLTSGYLNNSFSAINESDLLKSLHGIVEKKKPILVDWIKQSRADALPFLSKRIWSLLNQVDLLQLQDYFKKFGGINTKEGLILTADLKKVFQINSKKTSSLDKLVWDVFFLELSRSSKETKSDNLFTKLNFFEDALLRISQMDLDSKQLQNILIEFETVLERKKNMLLRLMASSKEANIYQSSGLIRFLWDQSGMGNFSLLSYKKKVQRDLLSQGVLPGFSGSSKINEWPISFSFQSLDMNDLIVASSDSKYLNKQVRAIIKKDIRLIFGPQEQYSVWSQRRRRSAIKRLVRYSQEQPQLLKASLEINLPDLILNIPKLQSSMSGLEWAKFSNFLITQFSEMRGILAFSTKNHLKIPPLTGNQQADQSKARGIQSFDKLVGYLPGTSDLSSKATLNKITAELFPTLGFGEGFTKELTSLLMLPSSFFSDRRSHLNWRKLLLTLSLRIRFKKDYKDLASRYFWESLEKFSLDNPEYFSFSTQAKNYPSTTSSTISQALSESGRTVFLKTIKKTNRTESNRLILRKQENDQLFFSLLFLKNEGHIPWWSPVQNPYDLLFQSLKTLEKINAEEAESLLLIFSRKGLDQVISDLNDQEIRILISWLSKSKYKNYYQDLLSVLEKFKPINQSDPTGKTEERAERLNKNSEEKGISDSESNTNSNSDSGKRRMVKLDIDRLIKVSIHQSKEPELIRSWFFQDPRIQQQLIELLSWSPWMYASRLNPGIWKTLLLRFSYGFYIEDKKTFSRDFLGEFLSFLTRSHSEINWASFFKNLLRKQEFNSEKFSQYHKQISKILPFPVAEKNEEIQVGDQVKVRNAGLILCWPFLSVLFSRLGLVEEGIIPVKNQSRAVYILQNIVFGYYDFPEYELVLNKLLIGMKSSQHLEEVVLSDEEINLSESLIQGMKGNWDKMKTASIDAVRETFLQREGILEFGQEGYKLGIQKTGVDILLDSVSWNISMIRLPWMEKSLEVKWR